MYYPNFGFGMPGMGGMPDWSSLGTYQLAPPTVPGMGPMAMAGPGMGGGDPMGIAGYGAAPATPAVPTGAADVPGAAGPNFQTPHMLGGQTPPGAAQAQAKAAGPGAFGWAQLGVQGALAAGQLGLGIASYMQGLDQYNFQKSMAQDNYANSVQAYNQAVADRIRARYSTGDKTPAQIQAQINAAQIKKKHA